MLTQLEIKKKRLNAFHDHFIPPELLKFKNYLYSYNSCPLSDSVTLTIT